MHHAGPDWGDMRVASGLDLPEITSEHCLFAHWAAEPIRNLRDGQRKLSRRPEAGGFVVCGEGRAMVDKGRLIGSGNESFDESR